MFNLSEASAGNTGSIYQQPGIYDNVVISEVVLEKTTKNDVPYMKFITKGPNGEIGNSPKMFLSTDVKEGKKTSGWGVTARNLVDWIKATYNVDEDTAKTKITNINSQEQLIQTVSALLVGKPARVKFKGVTSTKGTIFAEVGQVESMRVTPTAMRYDASRDIKAYEGTTSTTVSNVPDMDALPFN